MKLPKITVVMPSFNQAAYIEESILSIVEQNYPNLEFIVMDGGSTDGSTAIIERYAQHYTYWQSKRDNGQTDALIQGFARATGEILGWVNSDDVLFPCALERMAQAYLTQKGTGIFSGNYVVIDQDGRIMRVRRHPRNYAWFAQNGITVISPDWFFTREAYDRVGGLDPSIEYSMDLDLYLRMVFAGVEAAYIDADLVGYRIHHTSKTVANRSENHEVADRVSSWLWNEHNVTFNALRAKLQYHLWQTANGNHLRGFAATLRHRGQIWREYAGNS